MFLYICSANIADHIIDADIYDEAFEYFVDEVERIIHVLDDEAAPIEEVCAESEEEEKWKKLQIVLKEVMRICIQGPPTVSNAKKCAGNGLLTWWIGQNS